MNDPKNKSTNKPQKKPMKIPGLFPCKKLNDAVIIIKIFGTIPPMANCENNVDCSKKHITMKAADTMVLFILSFFLF